MPGGMMTIAIFHEPSGWSLPEPHVERIREAAGDLEVRRATTRAELVAALPETTHLIGFPLTEEHARSHAASLQWVQLAHSSGDESEALVAILQRGVRVASAGAVRAPQVAEHAMALVLAMIRRIDGAVRAQGTHEWASDELSRSIRTLNGLTIGILSSDSVDDELARRASAFGARVLALRRRDDTRAEEPDEILERDQVDDLIRRSDAVVVAVSRMRATRNLFDAGRFALMKPSAILVDVSRGGVIDQEALLRALRRGRIAGAGLDVFEQEPLPRTSPLWTMANVIISPHVGAATPDYWQRATTFFCENLGRILADEDPIDELRPEWYGIHATTHAV